MTYRVTLIPASALAGGRRARPARCSFTEWLRMECSGGMEAMENACVVLPQATLDSFRPTVSPEGPSYANRSGFRSVNEGCAMRSDSMPTFNPQVDQGVQRRSNMSTW